MNVLLTGASGFIGSHLARALRAAEYVVIEARRDVDDGTASVAADFTRDLSARDWLPKLAGIDAVINAVGIVREHGAQTFEAFTTRAAGAVHGVRCCWSERVVQISALGADRGMTRYLLSKRAADDYLATLPLEWTIVRPAMVFGPGASSSRLFAKLARLPVVPLPGRGEQRVQPLHIDDLTEALVHLLGDASTHRARVELVGPQSFSLRELLAGLRAAKHLSPPRFLRVPMPLVRAATHIAALKQIAVDSETLAILEAGTRGDPATIRHLLGGRRGRLLSERRVTSRRRSRLRAPAPAAHRGIRAPSNELTAGVRLVEPAERMRALGELASRSICVSAGEDAANAEALVHDDCRFNAVCDAREADVHQCEIGMLALGDVERLGRGRRQPDAFDADRAQLQLAIDCDEVLIFDDENAGRLGHFRQSSLWGEGVTASS